MPAVERPWTFGVSLATIRRMRADSMVPPIPMVVSVELAFDAIFLIQSVMRADGTLAPGERGAIDAVARVLGIGSIAVPPSRPNALRAARADVEREMLYGGAAWMGMADGRIDPTERVVLDRYAASLALSAGRVRRIERLAEASFHGEDSSSWTSRQWSTAYATLVATIVETLGTEI